MRFKLIITVLLALLMFACSATPPVETPKVEKSALPPILSSPSPEAPVSTPTAEPMSTVTPIPANPAAPALSIASQQITLSLPKGFEYEYSPKSLAWSPDSKTIASGTVSGVVAIWDVVAEKMIHSMWLRRDLVYSVAYSPDGQRLASGDDKGVIQVWTPAGALLKTMQGHTNAVTNMAWSPNGERLYTLSYDNRFRVWDMTAYEEALSITGEFTPNGGSNFMDMALSPDGNMIAIALYNRAVEIRDSATGDIRQTLDGFTDRVQLVSFAPDGSRLFVRTYDGQMTMLDASTWQIQWNAPGLKGPVYSMAWSPNGNFLASGTLNEFVSIWSANDGSLIQQLQRSGVNSMAWSPDGSLLAFATSSGVDLTPTEIQSPK